MANEYVLHTDGLDLIFHPTGDGPELIGKGRRVLYYQVVGEAQRVFSQDKALVTKILDKDGQTVVAYEVTVDLDTMLNFTHRGFTLRVPEVNNDALGMKTTISAYGVTSTHVVNEVPVRAFVDVYNLATFTGTAAEVKIPLAEFPKRVWAVI